MSTAQQKHWCLFTSAGDKNAIRLWLEGGTPRRWDLIVAYYSDNDQEFAEIKEVSSYAFRTKGGKFQNLKKLVEQHPRIFDQYSYVWVCDDDIRMSGAQIDEAFAITECFQFWVAQPAFRPEGKISHWITCYAGPHCDYRVVNFIEVTAGIFSRDKLSAFLTVYDGSLTGLGIDYWYMNFFKANEFGRFAIIDKVQVTNPCDEEKGRREIDQLQPAGQRQAAWIKTKEKHGLLEFPHKIFAYCKIGSGLSEHGGIDRPIYEFPPELQNILAYLEMHHTIGWQAAVSYIRELSNNAAWQIAIHLARGFSTINEQRCNIIHRTQAPYILIIQNLERYPVPDAQIREIAAALARSLKVETVPTLGISYSDAGVITDVRFERMGAPVRVFHASSVVSAQAKAQTLAERLGYGPRARLLIVHADDLGVAHAVNGAFIHGLGTGLINSGSAMVPCPWFPEVATFARAHPEADIGLHLTLTSERPSCRWSPTAPRTDVPSLIDQQGYFHQTWTRETRVNPREVETELLAQIDKAYAMGLRPTHLDAHQFRLQQSGQDLFEVYLRVGRRHGLPILVVRDWFTQFPYLQLSLTPRDVVIDHAFTIGPETVLEQWEARYRRVVENLLPGVTQLIIHPGLNDAELQAFSADDANWGAAWRQRDLDFFTSDEFQALLAKHDIKLVTWREIAIRLRDAEPSFHCQDFPAFRA